MLPAQHQLRDDQAKEMSEFLVETMVKEKKHGFRPPLLADLSKAADEAKARQANSKAEKDLVAALAINSDAAMAEEVEEPKAQAGLLGPECAAQLDAESPEQVKGNLSGLLRSKVQDKDKKTTQAEDSSCSGQSPQQRLLHSSFANSSACIRGR